MSTPASGSSSPACCWSRPAQRWCRRPGRPPTSTPASTPTCCRPGSASSPCCASRSARCVPTRSTSTPARCRRSPSGSGSRRTGPARSSPSSSASSVSSLALFGIKNAGQNYENFLLVIAYWIGPWLGVVLVDRLARPRTRTSRALALNDRFNNPRGAVAMAVGMVISIWLFSNQTKYVGLLVTHHGQLGDITFLVGFLVAAGRLPRPDQLLPERGQPARTPHDHATSEMLAVAVEEARRAWPRAASRSAARSSAPTGRCSGAATTGACRTTTRRCTARPRRSGTPAASAAIAARRWPRRCRPAGSARG